MFAALPLHLALHLVPFLDPSDIARTRRVCKAWYYIFSSDFLSQVALRVHFPLFRETRRPSASRPHDYPTFNRISKRYAALKSGVPRQELRVPITISLRNTYVWTFSENLLVLQSSHYPRAVLTLIYLDARAGSRRIVNGEIVLDAEAGTVNRVKVCRNMLVVESTSEREEYSPQWLCSVDCFRLSLSPGDSELIATKISSFDTFGFDYADFSRWTISDHSGKYYAVYSGARGALQIWDIETGKIVQHIPEAEFPKILKVVNVLVIAKQGLHGPQQVVVAGNRGGHHHHPLWAQVPEWDSVADFTVAEFMVFPVESGPTKWTGGIEERKKLQSRSWSPPREAPHLASSFKVPRCPAGITSIDTPGAPGYSSEEVGLALWHWDSDAGKACSSYHSVTPEDPPTIAPDIPLAVEREFRMAVGGDPCFPPFTVGSRSGLSLTVDFTGRHEDFQGRRQKLYQLCVRSFYPSATPGVMDLEWETCLKSSSDKGETRGLYSANTNILNRNAYLLSLIDENELGTAFLEVVKGGMDLVLVLWDDGFHGELPLGGKVLN